MKKGDTNYLWMKVLFGVTLVMFAGLLGYTAIYLPNVDNRREAHLDAAVSCLLAHLTDHRVNTASAHMADAEQHGYSYERTGFDPDAMRALADQARTSCEAFLHSATFREGP